MIRSGRAAVKLSALLAAGLLGGCERAAERPPSMVVIVVDTLRADHVGAYGYARATTPGLDAHARAGALFEHAFSTSSWTVPSFASILTGQILARHGAGRIRRRAGRPVRRGGGRVLGQLDPSVQTLAEMLGERGWATAAIVSNHFLDPRVGVARGFQSYDYLPADNGAKRRADRVVDAALAWLDLHAGPFFLVIHFFDPHMAYDAPPATRGAFTRLYAGAGRLPVDSVPEIRRSVASLGPRERAFIVAAYDEEIAFVDHEIDRLLGELARRGVLGNGLAILTADHGEELFEHGSFEHGHSLFQELLHVPFIVWGRGVRPQRIGAPVSLVDVVPTALESLGLPPPGDLAGISLWPLLMGVGRTEDGRALTAQGTLSGPEQRALIEWPYKLIDAGAGREQLYDLVTDSREVTDIKGEQPDVAARMSSRLREVVDGASRLARGSRDVALDRPTLERLRALGYLE